MVFYTLHILQGLLNCDISYCFGMEVFPEAVQSLLLYAQIALVIPGAYYIHVQGLYFCLFFCWKKCFCKLVIPLEFLLLLCLNIACTFTMAYLDPGC